jgi:hypothetical protein
MIQVCSQCGTRWNVRDRERAWCPRCHGMLLAPSAPAAHPGWGAPPTAAPGVTPQHATPQRAQPQRVHPQRSAPRLPPGYRWIAVRPGAAPSARQRRRPLGPTPRYPYIPRWGLADRIGPAIDERDARKRAGPSRGAVLAILIMTVALLGFALLANVVQYVLLIVNRGALLSPLTAGVASWLRIVAGVAAVVGIIAGTLMLTRWLIARRAAAYEYQGHREPRRRWALWVGCLVPLVSLLWAPVYVIELATNQERYPRLRRPITVWWLAWVASTAVSVYAFATSFAHDTQGVADNTVATAIAYLVAVAAAAATLRMVLVFERNPVARPAHRWVVVGDDASATGPSEHRAEAESAVAVESEDQEPAA